MKNNHIRRRRNISCFIIIGIVSIFLVGCGPSNEEKGDQITVSSSYKKIEIIIPDADKAAAAKLYQSIYLCTVENRRSYNFASEEAEAKAREAVLLIYGKRKE